MRTLTGAVVAVGLLIAGSVAPAAVPREDVNLEGQWKLVVLAFADDDFIIFKSKKEEDKLAAETVSAQQFLPGAKVESIDVQGDKVTIKFQIGGTENVFQGTAASEGDNAGTVLGTFRFRDTPYPARLEKTEEEKVNPTGRNSLNQQIREALMGQDAKARVQKLQELIDANAGKPSLRQVYANFLRLAADAEVASDKVRETVDQWINDVKPYGQEVVTQVRQLALESLHEKEQYADVSLALAEQAEKTLGPDATAEAEAGIVRLYASAAKLAGKADLASSLEARLNKLEEKLDAEYNEKVPPFKPEQFAGRRDPKDDRVVVMELFTGTQCPPCVAADVGFDGLLRTYKPTELVALQYHLHIPGPDPLTNPASLNRAKYYGVNSTPSTFFNGKAMGQGGGGMAQSKGKYDQYRSIIEENLYGKKPANIDLRVKRQGNKVEIAAAASATLPPPEAKKDDAKDEKKASPKKDSKKDVKAGEKKDSAKKDEAAKDETKDEPKEEKQEPQLRLRLVLTEETVKYVGGNKVRFHHQLVRAFPGGIEGQEFADGKAESKVSLNLDDVRQEIGDYLTEYTKNASFANPAPQVDLKNLSVVAIVQDDSDKSILYATSVAVPEN